MSDIPTNQFSHSDEEAVVDVLKSPIDNINYISSDSASTFEYVEENLDKWRTNSCKRDNYSPLETIDYDDVVTSMPLASTKEEKQRHNEEIAVMDSVAASSSSNSWEAVAKSDNDMKESCLLFLRSERNNSSLNENSTPSKSSKPCFIDASSLLDEEDLIYTPPPSVAHRPYNSINMLQLQRSFADEDKDDNLGNPSTTNYDIKDQYAAIEKTPIRSPNVYSPVRMFNGSGSGSRENERQQGNLIFQNTMSQYSAHLMKHQQQQLHDDVYTSDMSSIQSAYSSASGGDVHRSEFSHYNSLVENTSDYNSSFSRTQSDNDSSIVLPDTPFNSIVQVASQQLKIYEENDLLDGGKSRPTSNPMKIPHRAMKYDELAPILSGGASVKDFTPKQCESPNLKRKTDTCPIVSGGSVDVIESGEEKSTPKATRRSSTSSHSWVVDFNELKIKEDEDDDGEIVMKKTAEFSAKSLDYSNNANNSMGFYVDFGSLKENNKIQEKPRPAPRAQKPTGFYVDFSEVSTSSTPTKTSSNNDKNVVSEDNLQQQKPAPTTTENNNQNVEKKNMFSMFIDLNDEVGSNVEQKTVVVDQMPEAKVVEREKSKSPPENDAKKGCYMFIESDSPVVRRRQLISKNDTGKRHSWNVNQQDEPSEAQRAAKTYQRSTSVTNEKGVMNILEKIPILSKTSSMSIDSSVSPYEDFSCSKSFSSYSNNSATSHSSNSSIEHSGTKVPIEGIADVMTASAKKRRKDAKMNETFDKSSQGSITEGILSQDDSTTDTDDVTFQNQDEDKVEEIKRDQSTNDFKAIKMETIPEISENSPLKKVEKTTKNTIEVVENLEKKDEDFKIETHTMESLQALIEKQKQILENNIDSPSTSISFVKLSDLDKPMKQNIYENGNSNNASSMSNSAKVSRMFQHDTIAGHRSLTLQNDTKTNHSWNMSRSTGNNNLSSLASSVENFRSLTRLFPHLTDGKCVKVKVKDMKNNYIHFLFFIFIHTNNITVISTSVHSNVAMNSFDQSFIDRLEFVSSDFSCTSSVTSSRSGMGESTAQLSNFHFKKNNTL
jgi:BTB/POZ domain-containing protein 8